MPENDRKDSDEHWSEPESRPAPPSDLTKDALPEQPLSMRSARRTRVAQQLNDSTLQLLAMLQLRLDHLRELGDPRSAEIAFQCENVLAEIREEISQLNQDAAANDLGGAS